MISPSAAKYRFKPPEKSISVADFVFPQFGDELEWQLDTAVGGEITADGSGIVHGLSCEFGDERGFNLLNPSSKACVGEQALRALIDNQPDKLSIDD